ncbi:excinuclease ABC subunit UvrC [Paraferrimonas sp. SM1919]|uniref:excinuclease ABC subunit UvrC n=1 Tax=Paraferrimonas sp. SM1919 TaxID=2662263 RepID=UPI0013D88AC1|nr:excinuclease ABC subunit UvrC [Paraferrimonas sp. SM1919]
MSQFDSKEFLKHCTSQAGVYRMYNQSEEVIYVGKAKNLKKRLSTYFQKTQQHPKTLALVANIHHIDVTVVHSETDALILENDYIKQYMPKYNVLLRDDKSYPYIFLSDHKHPRLAYHRGAKRLKGQYFGPYPNGGAVKDSLHLLQKLFPIRQCQDSYYRARSRPCLQYQIGRCSGPCVDKISEYDYQQQVNLVRLFLKGRNDEVIHALIDKMEQAANKFEYEQAAVYRDQIESLRKVSEQQEVSKARGDLDVIGIAYQGGMACFHLLSIRQGKINGSRSYFPKVPSNTELDEVLSSFMLQFYLNTEQRIDLPSEIIVAETFEAAHPLAQVLKDQGHNIQLRFAKDIRGDRAKFLGLAQTNAQTALDSRMAHKANIEQRYQLLEEVLNFEGSIQHMECFDISHTMGEATVASCVVFDRSGPKSSNYRRFNIKGITPGDDYAAMAQVIERRIKALNSGQVKPDIMFIDGGLGQLKAAEAIVDKHLEDPQMRPLLIGVAKGEGRKAGLETLIMGGSHDRVNLDSHSSALHLIQHIRDESHRFAIAGHRGQRQKKRMTSTLEGIPGIGPKKRKALIQNLGGIQGVKAASVAELTKVPGISKDLAQLLFDSLRDS